MSMKAWVGVLIACSVWPVCAQERALHWDRLSVSAHLDDQGVLHIAETHTMVFDGAWNGGERALRLAPGQQLHFVGLSEIDASQEPTAWSAGDLDRVGEYRLDGTTLRWRARMANDPPFDHAAKTYEIRYALSGVLTEHDGGYLLSHDFAFPDRDGEIRSFDASLTLSPQWQSANDASLTLSPQWQSANEPLQWYAENLQPGESVIVVLGLDYTGAQPPAALGVMPASAMSAAAMPLRYALFALLIVFVLLHVAAFVWRERARGRFRATVPLDQVDEAWLDANVFTHRPEVIGAVWDLQTSAPEVAALLARLAQAGLLKSEVRTHGSGLLERQTLHMELACERDRFAGYERALIDGLFIGGTTIDSERLRKHYAKRGFSPAKLIRKGIEQQWPDAFAQVVGIPKWVHALTAGLLVSAIAACIVSAIRALHVAHVLMIAGFMMMFVFTFGLVMGFISRDGVEHLRGKIAGAWLFVALLCAVAGFVLISKVVPVEPWGAAGITMLAMGFVNAIFSAMWLRQAPETIAIRQRLGVARRYFQRELQAQQPRLQDAWFPYLLAFGLGSQIDKWFAAFGGTGGVQSSATLGMSQGSSRGGGVSGGTSSTWTGGGGAFGGAGASGAWASAVSGIAAGVASPSSGGSSGSRSGGSSRSGGGGGGGW